MRKRVHFGVLCAGLAMSTAGAVTLPATVSAAHKTTGFDIGVSVAPASSLFELGPGQAQWFVTVYNLGPDATPADDILAVQGTVDFSEPTSPAQTSGSPFAITTAGDGNWFCSFVAQNTSITGPGYGCFAFESIPSGGCISFTMQLDQLPALNPPTSTARLTASLSDFNLRDVANGNDSASAVAGVSFITGSVAPPAPQNPPACIVPGAKK
jgi:hypothetical protein